MNDTIPASGHNNPPDPLDQALAPYDDFIIEAENWLDGACVTDERSMKAVDEINKQIKAAKRDVTAAQKSESAPLYDTYKAALARYKPTIEDLDRISKGLTSLVDAFKRKLAEEKREAERKAWQEAEHARQAAERAAREANVGSIEDQRVAAAAKQAAVNAEKAAQEARRETKGIKGLRTVTRYEIESHKKALNDIAQNDREAMVSFIEDYVRQNHKSRAIDGVRVWQEKEAF